MTGGLHTTPNMLHIGLTGFVWWFGIVEDRKDPLNLGRARVRIYSWHSEDKQSIPTDHLPWAHPLHPVNGGHGSVAPPKEGALVMGFFGDGKEGQFPIIMGILNGIPEETPSQDKGFSDQRTDLENYPRPPKSTTETKGTGVTIEEEDKAPRYPNVLNEPHTSRYARNEKTDEEKSYLTKRKSNRATSIPTATGGTWDEPETTYNTAYPFNNVKETESGHIIEIDDTPKAERIHERHRSGTFDEKMPDGSNVTRIVKDDYEIVLADKKMVVYGKCDITVYGDCGIYVKKDCNVKTDGNLNVNSKDINLTASGNMTLTATRIDLNQG